MSKSVPARLTSSIRNITTGTPAQSRSSSRSADSCAKAESRRAPRPRFRSVDSRWRLAQLEQLQGQAGPSSLRLFDLTCRHGSVEPVKKLHGRWGHEVNFVDVITRQAHPGPGVPAYANFQQKTRDAEIYKAEEEIPWGVLVDNISRSFLFNFGVPLTHTGGLVLAF